MTFIYLLLSLLVGFLPIGFSQAMDGGPHSGGLATTVIVLVMLWDVMKRAQEEHKVTKTIVAISVLLIATNIIILALEFTTNMILHDSLYQTFNLDGFTVETPSNLGLALPFIYAIPRALITIVACKIYRGKTSTITNVQ